MLTVARWGLSLLLGEDEECYGGRDQQSLAVGWPENGRNVTEIAVGVGGATDNDSGGDSRRGWSQNVGH